MVYNFSLINSFKYVGLCALNGKDRLILEETNVALLLGNVCLGNSPVEVSTLKHSAIH